MKFIKLEAEEEEKIRKMSAMAKVIVKEHFDPVIGPEQNDYMIGLFQTVEAITDQLRHGYQYYFVEKDERTIGFLAFYPRGSVMYLSKFYLYKEERRKGYSRQMMGFVEEQAKALNLEAVELNVNRNNSACLAYEGLGFTIAREEKNDIGQGFYMDDYVYRKEIS